MALTRFPVETDQPRIEVTLPVGIHTLELVVVDSAGLRSEPDTVTITVREEPLLPEISGIEPTSAVAGRTMSAVITGRNLRGARRVEFEGGGIDANVVSSGDPERLVVVLRIARDARPGPRRFTVTTPAGTAESPEGVVFTVEAVPLRPRITGIEPVSGTVGSTVNAVISGSDLQGATRVDFRGDGVTAVISGRVSPTRVPVRVTIARDAATGPRSFSVTTPAGTATSPRDVFFEVRSVSVMPQITGIEPSSGRPGTTVSAVISGIGLGGASAVTFSGTGVAARISGRVSPNRVPISISISPRAPTGPRSFTVTTPAGRATSPRDVSFTVTLGFVRPGGGTIGVNEIEGVGPVYTERLTASGITSAEALATEEPTRVARILGVSEDRARLIINNARTRVGGG